MLQVSKIIDKYGKCLKYDKNGMRLKMWQKWHVSKNVANVTKNMLKVSNMSKN